MCPLYLGASPVAPGSNLAVLVCKFSCTDLSAELAVPGVHLEPNVRVAASGYGLSQGTRFH